MEGRSRSVRLAIVVVGGTAVGIDVAAVAQALPLPAALAPLPRRAGALAGVADCDGAPLPVVDLARWVDVGVAPPGAGPPGAVRRILVLREGGRRLGMLVDAIDGFADVPAGALARLHHDDGPDEVFQAMVTVPSTGALLGVLETGRLMALARAWIDAGADEPGGDVAGEEALPAAVVERVNCAVLRAGKVLLALPTMRLAAVEPLPALERIGPGTTAFCAWRGRHVPVVDALAATGQGSPAARPLLAVVEDAGRLLGLAIDGVRDMRPLAPPEPGAAVPTVYDEAGEALVFVAVEPLFARYPETALSCAGGQPGARRDTRAGNAAPLLLFDAGATLAIAAAAVEQVLPFTGAEEAAPATMPWQGRAIAVVDRRRGGGQGHLMIVRHGAAHAACVVDAVRSLVPAGAGRLFTLAQPGRGKADFVEVADGERQGSYRIVDAEELAGAG
ncbi:chemotaxis protein CheW [Massilia sp. METH4]|uniref:chemotaxis protein CheW n=1 Tax=Massilia sp. METH4 TaxID=3123041 RepID=UPI0030CC208E